MNLFFERMETLSARMAKSANWIGAGAIVCMMLVTCLDVVLRFFRCPFPGTYEIVGMLGAVFVSFSLAQTSVEKGHIAVDFLVQKLPEKVQYAVEAANSLTCFVLFSIVSGQCFIYAMDLKKSGEVSMTLQMPVHPFVTGIAIGCAMLGFVLVVEFFKFTNKAMQSNG